MNAVKSNGASNTLFQHERPNQPKRSKFDLSRLINFSIDTGMAVPFDFFPVLPNDSGYINIRMAMDTLPLIQASLTNYKVLIHWYYMKNRDLWKGWKTFITKGRSGNIELELPKVDLSSPIASGDASDFDSLPSMKPNHSSPKGYSIKIMPKAKHSLSSFLGVPSDVDGFYVSDASNQGSGNITLNKDYLPYSVLIDSPGVTFDSSSKITMNDSLDTGFHTINQVNALPFMMYQSIVKNNYCTPNLLQDNKALFPDAGDDDWLLPYSIPNNICNYVDGTSSLSASDKVNYDGIYSSDETKVDLRLLRYGLYDDDYFTTGLPWLQRGDVSSIDFDVDVSNFGLDFSDSVLPDDLSVGGESNPVHGAPVYSGDYVHDDDTDYGLFGLQFNKTSDRDNLISALNLGKLTGNSLGISITANMLRNLLAISVWQERNARVDGSYNRMIFQHWSTNPHSEEHKPVYLGGTATYLNFSTVLQNSESSNSSPLGATAGFGSASGSDNVCNFNVDDYGYIMGIMIVKPNTIYEQGVERTMVCENVFDDFIQPEFEGLSPQAILNKEIFVSSTSADNDDLFAYQERNTSYKVRQNVNRGLFQCKPDKDLLFGAFTQARWFENKPELSYQFCVLSPDNIRRDWLAYPVYPAFRCQLLSEVFVTRSLSYSSQPNTFGF